VARELLAFIEKQGTPGVMPTKKALEKAGYSNIANAIEKNHGGYWSVAQKLSLICTKKKRGGWKEFDNVARELLAFIEKQGTPGVMPTEGELTKASQGSLLGAIKKHGGTHKVAEALGLNCANKGHNHWDDFANVKGAVLAFIDKQGTPGLMPTQKEFSQAGQGNLAMAIAKHGGFPIVAKRLRLKLRYTKRPLGHWNEFTNVENELLAFIEKHGFPGIMPGFYELIEHQQSSLAAAIQRHGGFSSVARRLGLTHTDKEYVTPRTASEVERTARAIQPLAASNLLTGAQVMVILRRAGLLEYRNKRVVRLGASLARGNHDEIETAISQLASTSEEITTETNNIEESETLTAEEAEALVNSGLESTENPPPDKSTPEPDTQREQAVIRGLTALGELRLPLDEVLSLLTSKLLWQAFYKRLYKWYGGLDAAQNITAEDVKAAILNTYPEHTDNEFVAEASARFTLEVEQAVNFAASLSNHDWHGFRLRLHQADAARRMAEVLTNQNIDQYCPNRINLTPPTPLPCKGRGESGSPLLAGEGLGERSSKQYRNCDYPFLLNADDPGMGKSASFLAAVCASGIKSVVLIAPKTVADDTWYGTNGEIHRCLPHAKIVRGLDKTLSASSSSRLTFYVLHYEELLKSEAIATLAEQSFDCLCLDEIHFIKKRAGQQEGSLRREALKDLRQAASAAIGLTGTPLINELAEPMSLLQTLSNDAPQFDHSRLSNRRLSDIADVFEALLPHIIRRRKRSVLLHLPSCDVQPVDIPLPEEIEQQMQETHKWPKSRATEQLNELRKLATEAKLAYLQQQAESARKLLILTYLTDDVSEKIAQYLEEFLPNQVAHINGQTPIDERQKQLDSFRKSDGVRVLVGTIRTIGTGLTLFDPSCDDTANQIIIADLPYTWAEFEQGIARLHREGQKHRVCVSVLQTKMLATRGDGSAYHTIDEQIWALIQGKRELSDVAVDGKYDTNGASAKVQEALRRWLKQTREMGVEPRRVERRSDEQSEPQKWRRQIAHLRAISTAKADELFADPEYTRQFLAHLKNSPILQLSHQWLRGKLSLLLRPDLTVIDMGCGLNPFADLPCHLIGLDRHHQPEQPSSQYLRGKMENPPLPDKSADVLIYSLSLFGTPSDLMAYFTQAVRILRGGGHLFIVELDSTFTPEGLARFIKGLSKFGFELVGSVKDLWSKDRAKLKGMHFTLTGERGKPEEADFERK
jgi:SAM-dependent methyltransferase